VIVVVAVLLAADIATVQLAVTSALSLAGIAAGAYATRRMMLSDKRTAEAEKEANSIKDRTVDREDFDSVVEGLRGVIAERTTSYNELLVDHRANAAALREAELALRQEREHCAEKDRRIAQLEGQLRNRRPPGGRHD
jgi:DNA repair exonuclease SbcCD ATPase subunit